MTLTATIGDPGTRITATDDEAGRKLTFKWEAGDQVSVVSVNSSNQLICNDIFTTAEGGPTATFAGVFNGGASAAKVVVFYPALTESYVESGKTKWQVPPENGYDDEGVLYGLCDSYIWHRSPSYFLQKELGSPSHLKNYLVLRGEADINDIKSNNLTVNLEHMTTVLKLRLTLPSPGLTLCNASVYMEKADGSDLSAVGVGWGYISRFGSYPMGGNSYAARICLGSSVSGGNGTGLTAAGTETTLYLPFVLQPGSSTKYTFTDGQKFVVYVYDSAGREYTETKQFTGDTDLEPGKLYTINSAPVPATP